MKVVRKPGPNGETLKGVVDAIKGIAGVRGSVGWFENSKYPGGTPVALVAATQEFGHGPIPPRPFMRPTIAQEKAAWSKGFADGTRAVLKERFTPEQVMEQVAGRAAGDVRKTISEVTTPALSPITIELRRRKRAGETVTGRTVGEAAKATKSAFFEGGNSSASENKPLVFTARMLNTLTHQVEKK